MKSSKLLLAGFLVLSLYAPHSQAQTATISWNNVNQEIDGFGASDGVNGGVNLTSAQAATLFGTGSGQLGLSLLRTAVPDDGSCTTVSTSCVGVYLPDMQTAISYGAKVWATAFSPPASMKTNGSIDCTTGGGKGALGSGSYGAFATYLSNFIQSLSAYNSIPLYAVSIQNEPEICESYDSSLFSDADFDSFIKSSLGPTLAAAGQSSTLIMMPEVAGHYDYTNYSGACMGDSSCASYVGINAWHDYDASYSPPGSVDSTPNTYASQGKKYWETEASAGSGYGPSLCGGCWDPSMADGLLWAAIVDDRVAVENANAWHYWWLVDRSTIDNEGLIGGPGMSTIAKHAYVLGQYARFVRPGFNRIDATHAPQAGVTVSAYKDSATGAFAIVATNQNSSSVSQEFAFNGVSPASVTPYITSSTLNIAPQSSVNLTGGAFSYTLPASSVTTFVGNTSTLAGPPTPPAPPTGLSATIQ